MVSCVYADVCVFRVCFTGIPPALVQPVAPTSERLGQDRY